MAANDEIPNIQAALKLRVTKANYDNDVGPMREQLSNVINDMKQLQVFVQERMASGPPKRRGSLAPHLASNMPPPRFFFFFCCCAANCCSFLLPLISA